MTAHAAWCDADTLCGRGSECYAHPYSPIVATYQTTHDKGEEAFVETVIGRVLNPEFRLNAVPDGDTALISIGVGRHGYDADEWTELTVAEARKLARQLSELCDMADADAKMMAGWNGHGA